MAFYYNCIYNGMPAPTLFETSVGQGIAGIILTLLDQNGQPVFKLALYDRSDHDDTDVSTILEYLKAQQGTPQSTPRSTSGIASRDTSGKLTATAKNCNYKILVEMWSQGPLNSDTLIERIIKGF